MIDIFHRTGASQLHDYSYTCMLSDGWAVIWLVPLTPLAVSLKEAWPLDSRLPSSFKAAKPKIE
jgi:hypothetical protein